MKVAIYGGSFNPIHRGHTGLARNVCKTGVVDEVWLMVSPLNPLKSEQQNDLLPTDVRLHMARLATEGVPCLKVSDFETRLPSPSYTYNTFQELRRAYPEHTFSLLVGEDNWQRFPQWFRADDIRAAHDIIVFGREAASGITVHHSDGSTALFPQPRLYAISSTQIREAIGNGHLSVPRRWLHPAVYRYVRQQQLYVSPKLQAVANREQ